MNNYDIKIGIITRSLVGTLKKEIGEDILNSLWEASNFYAPDDSDMNEIVNDLLLKFVEKGVKV